MRLRLLSLGFCLGSLGIGAAAYAADDGWRPLFNGKDFSGWECFLGVPPSSVNVPGVKRGPDGKYLQPLGVNNDPLHTFSVVQVDGAPAIRMTGPLQGGITTLESFSNYHLKFQFKWGEHRKDQRVDQHRNSGFLYHAYGVPGEVKGRWMNSHQFQIAETQTGDYIAMGTAAAQIHARSSEPKHSFYDPAAGLISFGNNEPAGPYCYQSDKDYEKPAGEWNTLEIICLGDTCIQVVNGHVTMRVTASQRSDGKTYVPLTQGRLELDMEGWEIYFRDLDIRPITEIPAEYAAH